VPNPSKNRQDPQLVALGAAIRRARLAKGLSQEHLALQAEIDRSYLGRVERGDNNVAILTLIKIASSLGHAANELLADAGL
jgi:transcriptional regulator with XRE-family HTH domain